MATISIAQNEPGPFSIPVPDVHPVAAVMPGITNLVAYHAANSTSVLKGSDKFDDEVSAHPSSVIGALIENADSVMSTPPY